jgi:8-oxo-dGTP pyrophosphatase MutT (NUDIX family)
VQYLLLQYGGGHWDYVKGQIEPDEIEKDTAMREIKEETGIVNAHLVKDFREEIRYFYKREGKTIYKEVVFFLVEARESRVTISYEHVGFIWLDYKEALAKLTFNNAKNVLEKAHEFLRTRGIA